MEIVIKDSFEDEITIETETIIDSNAREVKAVRLSYDGDMVYELEQLNELIKALEKAREAIS